VTPALEDLLVGLGDDGWKAFVPYVTAGLPGVDGPFLRTLQEIGADAIEIGIPFSDPVMDGPVIQEASRRALERGTTPGSALELIAEARLEIPAVVMTYLNPVLAYGERFVDDAVSAGAAGVVVPDLPVDEAEEWIGLCAAAQMAPVFLAAPNSTPERLKEIADASRGFVYCVSSFGVTGTRMELAPSARAVVEALRPLTDRPLLVGVGISSTRQAREACGFADGVVVGSALVGPLLRGQPEETLRRAEVLRKACQ
jgi:tryptophan synthase alpha chain